MARNDYGGYEPNEWDAPRGHHYRNEEDYDYDPRFQNTSYGEHFGQGRNYDRDYDSDYGSRVHHGRQGFASMEPEEVRRIARMGGLASHGHRGPEHRESLHRGHRRVASDYDSDYDYEPRHHYGDTSRRGFASMDEREVRRIASMGGHAAHEQGVAHEWNSEEAREAGHLGGLHSHGGHHRSSDYDNVRYGNTGRRGFASMDDNEVRRIASTGGHAAHEQGVAHEWTSKEAREAGHLGGLHSHGGHRRVSDYDNNYNRDSRGRFTHVSHDYDEDYGGRSHRKSSGASKRGFAAMSPAERSRIARMGGLASHSGRGHR